MNLVHLNHGTVIPRCLKCLFSRSRHTQTPVHTRSTDLPDSFLQRIHQLKDWLPLPPAHLFPALKINGCQSTPPSDCQAAAQYFLPACSESHAHTLTWSSQGPFTIKGSSVWDLAPLIIGNRPSHHVQIVPHAAPVWPAAQLLSAAKCPSPRRCADSSRLTSS